MRVYLQHVGHPGNIDVAYTVTRRREVDELTAALPADAPERQFFEGNELRAAFPTGSFNCWGVPPRAAPRIAETRIGDLLLIAPEIGLGGGIEALGIVKAVYRAEAWQASRVLWPITPNERLFPYLLFFDSEIGVRPWFDFLEDVGYEPNWNPRGWYRPIADSRFARFGGPERYLEHLRTDHGFKPLQ